MIHLYSKARALWRVGSPDWTPCPSPRTPVGCVLADAEFDSERNHTFFAGN
jgi:hypothetical protein